MVAAEEIVLASERYGADLVLGEVVVEQKASVIEHGYVFRTKSVHVFR